MCSIANFTSSTPIMEVYVTYPGHGRQNSEMGCKDGRLKLVENLYGEWKGNNERIMLFIRFIMVTARRNEHYYK